MMIFVLFISISGRTINHKKLKSAPKGYIDNVETGVVDFGAQIGSKGAFQWFATYPAA